MKFQIVEFNDARVNSKFFSVRVGTIVWEKWYKRKTIWEWNRDNLEDAAQKYNSFTEAMEAVEELKRQIPVYHNIK